MPCPQSKRMYVPSNSMRTLDARRSSSIWHVPVPSKVMVLIIASPGRLLSFHDIFWGALMECLSKSWRTTWLRVPQTLLPHKGPAAPPCRPVPLHFGGTAPAPDDGAVGTRAGRMGRATCSGTGCGVGWMGPCGCQVQGESKSVKERGTRKGHHYIFVDSDHCFLARVFPTKKDLQTSHNPLKPFLTKLHRTIHQQIGLSRR